MQALGVVRISKNQNFIEISFEKISEFKIMGLGRHLFASWMLPQKHLEHHIDIYTKGSKRVPQLNPHYAVTHKPRKADSRLMGLERLE